MPWFWLGTWSLGGEGFGPHDSRESLKVLDEALHSGICHYDTADFYAHGKSERLLAKAFAGQQRERLFISSKGGLGWEGNRVVVCGEPLALRRALIGSLERLKTDYIDLYQLHWPDPKVPLDVSIAALRDLQSEGLIRFWGVCNLNVRQIIKHIPSGHFIPHQVHFNPLCQAQPVLAAGAELNRCVNYITSPLEQGLLATCQSAAGLEHLGKRDVRRRNPLFHSDAVRQRLNQLPALMQSSPISQVSVILLWILVQDGVQSIICGAKTKSQLRQSLQHVKWLHQLDILPGEHSDNGRRRQILRKTIGEGLWSWLNDQW